MKVEDRFWLLLSRHLAGEATREEESELQSMIDRSEELRYRYEGLLTYWGKSRQQAEIDVENAYQHVWKRAQAQEPGAFSGRAKWPGVVLRIAATLLLLAVAGWYVISRDVGKEQWINLAWESSETDKGQRSKIMLADGSTIWLNADSQIRYPEKFTGKTREVYLSGEAFFEVSRDPEKPFIIHLSSGDVQVLGTSFNVKAFEDDPRVETSVLTGKVWFITPPHDRVGDRDTVPLLPNYKAVYTKFSGEVERQKTNSEDDKSWADGRLVFKSQRFEEIAKVLERSFGKKIVFENDFLKNCRLTGTFQNNTLEEIIRLFAETKDYTYTISENELTVDGTGCSEN